MHKVARTASHTVGSAVIRRCLQCTGKLTVMVKLNGEAIEASASPYLDIPAYNAHVSSQ